MKTITHWDSVVRTTGIGSLPHPNVETALEFSFKMGIPFLPQIPNRDSREFMLGQALEGLPGVQLDSTGKAHLDPEIWRGRSHFLSEALHQTFSPVNQSLSSLSTLSSFEAFEPTPMSSSCWRPFLSELERRKCPVAKIQIAGPMTAQWAIELKNDESKNKELSSQIFRLILARSLAMVNQLKKSGVEPLLFLDEPCLYALSLKNPNHLLGLQDLKLMIQTLQKAGTTVGLHCCSNTHWEAIFGLGIDFLSIDTQLSFRHALDLQEGVPLEDFVKSGGRLSLGVIPTHDPRELRDLDPEKLIQEFFHWMRLKGKLELANKILEEALFTPACGLAFQSSSEAEIVLDKLVEVYEFVSIHEMKALPPLDPSIFPEASLEVSLIIPAKNSHLTLERTVTEAHQYLTQCFGHSFEIILVPNPSEGDLEDRSTLVAEELAKKFSTVRVFPHHFPRGKGAAIRTGFQHSRGRWIFLTDSDLPYELEFFDQAAKKLLLGYDLVTGNRRLPSSHFHVPVNLLPIAYGRHRLGLGFNRIVRSLFPILTTDTQAGIKALSRRLAVQAFSRMSCPGFLFDLEIFLTAIGEGYWQTDLPVTLHLNSEKSTVRILRECTLVANWLTRISWKNLWKGYGKKGHKRQKILTRYRQAPFSTRLFLSARWKLTPYSQMASKLPTQGKILDLGCGHGLFSLAAALRSPSREVFGIDHDPQRVELANQAVRDVPNIQLEKGNMVQPPSRNSPYSGIAMIDVMHYFDPDTQELLLKKTFDLLDKGGTLLVREVDPNGGLASSWNRFYEKMATGIGFTQAEKKGLHFRSRQEWENVMEKAGFRVKSERCSSFLFADILYTCERPHSDHSELTLKNP